MKTGLFPGGLLFLKPSPLSVFFNAAAFLFLLFNSQEFLFASLTLFPFLHLHVKVPLFLSWARADFAHYGEFWGCLLDLSPHGWATLSLWNVPLMPQLSVSKLVSSPIPHGSHRFGLVVQLPISWLRGHAIFLS